MADQLTDSEAKMLRERIAKDKRMMYLSRESQAVEPKPEILDLATKLLLAAKEKAGKDICTGCRKGLKYQGGSHQHLGAKGDTYFSATWFECKAEAIRNSDWGDLFEVK